ncbi:MAG: phage holin family protein [Patescibacteria group bacterium]|nr:phage holin family protein [Patescibacteria group bacterium]
MKIIIRILGLAAALLALSNFPGSGITVDSIYIAIVVAVIWGVLGLTVRPVLGILTLPINIITFGLFSFIINALLFWLLSTFIAGFHVAGFIPALVGSVVLSIVSFIMHKAF